MNKVSKTPSSRCKWNEHPRALVDDPSLTACRSTTLSTTLHDANYWRKRAKEARDQAEQLSSAEDKRELLNIAMAYERLAKLAADMKIVGR